MRRSLVLPIGLAIVSAITSACGAAPYAAVVDGKPISQASFNSLLRAVNANKAYLSVLQQQGMPSPTGSGNVGPGALGIAFVDQMLMEQISFALIHQAVVARHLSVDKSSLAMARIAAERTSGGASVFAKFPRWYQDLVTRQYAEVGILEASVAHIGIGSARLRSYYDTHRSSFVEICSSEIVSGTQAASNQVKAKVLAGMPFAAAAAKYSTDSATAAQGGRVGCAYKLAYGQAFGPSIAGQISSLPTGQVVGPTQMANGWILLEATSKTPVNFAQAEPGVRSLLLTQNAPVFSSFFAGQMARAAITVNPLYGKVVRRQGNVTIAPPQAPSVRGAASGPSGSAGTPQGG